MPDNDKPDEKPDVPSVEDRFRNLVENSSDLGGEGFDADWYEDDEPDTPGL